MGVHCVSKLSEKIVSMASLSQEISNTSATFEAAGKSMSGDPRDLRLKSGWNACLCLEPSVRFQLLDEEFEQFCTG